MAATLPAAHRAALTAPTYRGKALEPLIVEYRQVQAAEKEAKDRVGELRAEIIARMGDRPELRVGNWLLILRAVAATPAKVIDESMLGETIRGRKGHTVLEIVNHPLA